MQFLVVYLAQSVWSVTFFGLMVGGWRLLRRFSKVVSSADGLHNIYVREASVTSRPSVRKPRMLDALIYVVAFWMALPYLWWRYGARRTILVVAAVLSIGPIVQLILKHASTPGLPSDTVALIYVGASTFARAVVGIIIMWRGGMWEMLALRARQWEYIGNQTAGSSKSAVEAWKSNLRGAKPQV